MEIIASLISICADSVARAPDRRAHETCTRDSCFVLVPALNEEETIGRVVEDLRAHGFRRIRVIDNGSSDATALRAHSSGAEVMREPRRGYGRACWTALQNIPDDVEWILFCDADGSSDLRDLERLINAAPSVDLVLGDRTTIFTNRATMTFAQKFGNALATTLIRLGWGYRYADLGPLRLIRNEALKRIAMRDRGFGWTVEMQVRAIELGLRVCETPVRYRVRQGGRSKISGTIIGTLRAGVVIVFTIGKLLLTRWWRCGHFWDARRREMNRSKRHTHAAVSQLVRARPFGQIPRSRAMSRIIVSCSKDSFGQ